MTSRRQFMLFSAATLLLLLLAAVLLYVGGILGSTPDTQAASFYDGITSRIAPDGAPVLGSSSARITIVVFTDYACPHCAGYMETVRALVEDYVRPGDVRLEMRVLSGLDPTGSLNAARFALCTIEQNRFWEYQEELFALQAEYGRTAFSAERLIDAAAQLGIDTGDLASCTANNNTLLTRLQRSVELAQNSGLESLPAVLIRQGSSQPAPIIVNGDSWTGPVPLAQISSAIQTAATQ